MPKARPVFVSGLLEREQRSKVVLPGEDVQHGLRGFDLRAPLKRSLNTSAKIGLGLNTSIGLYNQDGVDVSITVVFCNWIARIDDPLTVNDEFISMLARLEVNTRDPIVTFTAKDQL
jgi:hypothetical protein